MKKYPYDDLEKNNYENSDLKNLPESCLYCAYRTKPSSALDRCTEYCKKAFQMQEKKA